MGSLFLTLQTQKKQDISSMPLYISSYFGGHRQCGRCLVHGDRSCPFGSYYVTCETLSVSRKAHNKLHISKQTTAAFF